MNIIFCDLCNESVPLVDLDTGTARRLGERVICARCESAMSGEHGGGEAAPAETPKALAVEEPRRAAPGEETTVVEVGSKVPIPAAPAAPASAGAAVGVALASVALLLAVGATAFLFDQIDVRQKETLAALEKTQAGAQEKVQSVEARLSGEVRQASTDLAESRAEIRELRTRIDELGAHQRQAVESLREDLVGLTTKAAALDALVDAVDRHEAEISKVAETAANLHAEVLRVAGRLNTVEETGERLLSEASVPVAEDQAPEWIGLVDDLRSENSGTRWQAVQALGATRDVAVAEHLTPMLKDPDIFVRMATARILGDLEAVIGIPALIDALEDPEASVREAAVVSLRSITGRDFHFDPGAKEADRAKRVKAWRDWWKKASEDLLGGETPSRS